ncbi:Uncharacterised protein [Mycobacteroides abscessus subsp. massiliense]|nr:Uncharacterised protein [Mycobacteroides abscessus subsp. massiliense]
MLVGLEVLGQIDDALGQHCDLRLGGTGIGLVQPVLGEDFLLLLCGQRHGRASPSVRFASNYLAGHRELQHHQRRSVAVL